MERYVVLFVGGMARGEDKEHPQADGDLLGLAASQKIHQKVLATPLQRDLVEHQEHGVRGKGIFDVMCLSSHVAPYNKLAYESSIGTCSGL